MPSIDAFSFSPTLALVVWALLALLVVLFFQRTPQTLILAKDDKGRLEISKHALHRVIEACCEQVRGIASARAQVSRRGRLLHTQLNLKIRPDAKLDAIHGYLTQEIADIYRQNLGVKDVGEIEIKVVGVVPAQDVF